jgi:hypothetical protein
MGWIVVTFVLAAMFAFLFGSSTSRLFVLGKVPHQQYSGMYKWVLGTSPDNPVIVGSSTVYKYLDGVRCGTMLDGRCYDLTSHAEMKEAAGKKYKIYTWKELLGD